FRHQHRRLLVQDYLFLFHVLFYEEYVFSCDAIPYLCLFLCPCLFVHLAWRLYLSVVVLCLFRADDVYVFRRLVLLVFSQGVLFSQEALFSLEVLSFPEEPFVLVVSQKDPFDRGAPFSPEVFVLADPFSQEALSVLVVSLEDPFVLVNPSF